MKTFVNVIEMQDGDVLGNKLFSSMKDALFHFDLILNEHDKFTKEELIEMDGSYDDGNGYLVFVTQPKFMGL